MGAKITKIFLLSCFVLSYHGSEAQTPYVYTIKADSVKITNCDSAELILENHTQGVPGFLFNTGNGRTIFKRSLVSLGNGSYIIGADTLKMGTNAWLQGGNSFGATGVLGTLDNNHLDLYTSDTPRARLTNSGHLLIGTTADNGQPLQVAGNAYFSGNVGYGQTSPAAPIDILQSLSGSSAISGINLTSSLNTTGVPTVFKMNVTNTASGAGSSLVNIAQDGISRLYIPTGGARVAWQLSGIQINTAGGTAGGITLNGSPVSPNQFIVSPGFAMFQSSAVTGANVNSFTFTSAIMQPTSGTMSMIGTSGTFGPTSGTANFQTLALSPTINQTGGANGTTWGLYINPNLTAASSWRALEVTKGNSYFGTTSGNVLVGTTVDNGNKLQVSGNASFTGPSSVFSIVNSATNTTSIGNGIAYISFGPTNTLTTPYPFYIAEVRGISGQGLLVSSDITPSNGPAILFQPLHSIFNNPTSSSHFIDVAGSISSTVPGSAIQNNVFAVTPTLNFTGSYNGTLRAFYYNPTITSVTASMNHIAWENVVGNMVFGSTSGHVLVGTTSDNGNILQVNGNSNIAGNLGVGTSSPAAQLHTTGTVRFAGLTQDSTQTRVIVSDASGNLYYRSASSLAIDEPLRSSLAVNGPITAKSLRLSATGWPDYVFDSTYSLPPLAEVETYIHKQHHLPGVASTAEMQKDGNDVGATQEVLLKKIEELTLYNIDQAKKIDAQNDKLAAQQKELSTLKAEMEELKKILLKK